MTVISINGGDIPTPDREPSEKLITHLETLLEQARSGEISGMATISLWNDRTASWGTVGLVGSYTMIGACKMAERELIKVASGEDE